MHIEITSIAPGSIYRLSVSSHAKLNGIEGVIYDRPGLRLFRIERNFYWPIFSVRISRRSDYYLVENLWNPPNNNAAALRTGSIATPAYLYYQVCGENIQSAGLAGKSQAYKDGRPQRLRAAGL